MRTGAVTILLVLLSLTSYEQVEGSSFNTAGWGLPLAPLAVMNPGAAGSGFATCDTNVVNFYNPAGNAGSGRTRLYQILDLQNVGSWDDHASDWVSRVNYSGTAWYIPLQDIDFGLQLMPISDAAFFTHEQSFDPTFADTSADGDDGSYYLSLQRSGGLYRAGLSLAWQLDPRLYVGIALDYIGGSTTSIWTLNYEQSAPPFDGQVIREAELNGWQPRFGVIAHPYSWLQCGLSWAPSVSLHNRVRIGNFSTAMHESISSSETNYTGELTAGLQLTQGMTRYKLDLLWSEAEKTDPDVKDHYQHIFALGYTHRGVNLRSNSWWQRIDYHTGFSWQEIARSWLTTPLQELTFTAGIGWQPLGSGSAFDTGVQLFNRGNLDDHGRQEVGIRLYLAVAIKEQWFQRRVEKGLP